MKYIVTWLIVHTVVISCPYPEQTKQQKDEFGRLIPYTEAQAFKMQMDRWVYGETICFRYDTSEQSKVFINRDSAISFLKRGKMDSATKRNSQNQGLHSFSEGNRDQMLSFKLDSIVTGRHGR